MSAKIISGAEIAEQIRQELRKDIASLKEKGVTPGLAVVLVGEDPASQSYVRMKGKACEELGLFSQTIVKPADTSEEELLALIDSLNADPRIHGILVQLPLPKHIDENKVILRIDPNKDVDGFHPINVGKMLIGEPGFLPCTPHGIQEMLIRSGVDPEGKHVVVVGRSNIVGKPVAAILVQKRKGANATVTIAHSRTRDLASITRSADILVAAMGSPQFIKADMVREGAVVIDVGSNRIDDPSAKRGYRWVGDVDFEAVKEKASAITPVPGGVGPMTIVMLMKNTVLSASRALEAD
ncbi:MAG: bifunctional methylenetetrahydrofolate dehydrogenase/methenyltetrahydrofolate cyclohydrolase FolD [Methanomassiliicoccaceae archaeon]|jgi:methylenetetrahydrofolate dehydrogenase (NADP+)/methenyltetrahydrofolate cyclohydrolase|nr:bifunctional methylenetetrahydrofolate dehydrogenase/methenyltetrahydrofolate cyclohydrolase FolD [Euryarchaeota archaeon]HOB37708.1 bifunctional methylenetetrahydrofolate dehydrogenase/methenyltetrahydrofolate cyclohydrolase FolD [Methanomassiliicoccaceae archaeon]HOL06984.1 bifunctional methylenetetrahydrofolate dehydrogenase/methenyltetrahydrofolate cyclohydrolase FolD [Methanomassiliicoccaceae archaeon]HOQ25834.1 bifunctional methylenetetrahydrofolate dehydrogenase/methenyltetrahydrofolat